LINNDVKTLTIVVGKLSQASPTEGGGQANF